MATRVHWACILVINCNVLLITYCYLYFCLHETDYAVHLHCSESNRGDMKGEFTWSSGALSELVLTQAVCWHSPDTYRTRNSHFRVTRKPHQAPKLCLRRICYTLLRAVESRFFCFQLSSCCFQLVKKSWAAQCRCLSGTPFECSSL